MRLVSLLALATAPLWAGGDAATQLREMAAKYRDLQSFRAEFLYTHTSEQGNNPVHRKATVNGEKMRFEILPGSVYPHEITVKDGRGDAWNIFPETHRYIKRPRNEKDSEPTEMVFMRSAENVQSPHYLPDETLDVNGTPHVCTVIGGEVLMGSPENSSRLPITFWIDQQSGYVVKNVLTGPRSSTTVLVLNFQPDVSGLDDSLFSFTPEAADSEVPFGSPAPK